MSADNYGSEQGCRKLNFISNIQPAIRMKIQIETLDISHAQDVQRLSEQLGYALSLEEIEANIREVGLTENSCSFVAIVDERIVGWIHAFKAVLIESKPYIEIGGLVVDEKHRGMGIGRKLCKRIIEWSKEKGADEIRVRSNIKREEAHQFYKALGFSDLKQQRVFQIHL